MDLGDGVVKDGRPNNRMGEDVKHPFGETLSEILPETFYKAFPTLAVIQAVLQRPPHRIEGISVSLQPEIERLAACGYYTSVQYPEVWSDVVRRAKHPPQEMVMRQTLLTLVSRVFCEFVAKQTRLLESVDAIVAVPAHPARYELRGMSLPLHLGGALEAASGVPFLPEALRSNAPPELQMRGMAFEKRADAIQGSMVEGVREDVVGQSLLLIDDVVCSGSTLREAARLLLNCGASRVYAVCLASCLSTTSKGG